MAQLEILHVNYANHQVAPLYMLGVPSNFIIGWIVNIVKKTGITYISEAWFENTLLHHYNIIIVHQVAVLYMLGVL